MCPNCRAFITVTDRVCPYCGVQLGPRAIDLRASEWGGSFLPRANLTSLIILILNCVFFLVELIVNYKLSKGAIGEGLSTQVVVVLGAKYAPLVFTQHQWWRLLTAGFLHGGFIHIAMNSWALFDLVGEVEQFYGTSRLVVAYLLSTFTGFLVSLYWSRSVSLGASAACFGLIGAMLALGLRRKDPLGLAVRAYYRRWAIYALVFSFLPGIDIAAHVGGFAGGFLVGLVGGLPDLPNSPKEIVWKALAGVAVAVTLYAFWQDYLSYNALLSQV